MRTVWKVLAALAGASALLFLAVCGEYTVIGEWRGTRAAAQLDVPDGALSVEREGYSATLSNGAYGFLTANYPEERSAFAVAAQQAELLRADGWSVEPPAPAAPNDAERDPDAWWHLRASKRDRYVSCTAEPHEDERLARIVTLLQCRVDA